MAEPVDVVICAHNEERTVASVVSAALVAPSLGRLVVVCDACTDNTEEEAAAVGLQLASHAGQLLVVRTDFRTKGSAMAEGLRHCETETVAFVDADLWGLRHAHVEVLLTHPPKPGMVVGLRDGYPDAFGRFPSISGERRVTRRLAEEVGLAKSGWEAELMLAEACQKAGLPWAHVVMRGVTNPRRPKPDEWRKVAGAAFRRAPALLRMVSSARKVRP